MTRLNPPVLRWWKALAAGLSCVVVILAVTPLSAHFLLNLNVRIFHVERTAEGLRLYLRTPMPYLVADKTGPFDADGLPAPAPFTTNSLEDGKPAHRIDPGAVLADPFGLGQIALDGLRVTRAGQTLPGEVERMRASVVGSQPDFATLEEARDALAGAEVYPADAKAAYVGDVVVDVRLFVATDDPLGTFEIASTLDPGLPGQEDTANLILDHGPGQTQVYRSRGLLAEPVALTRSAWSAIVTFIKEGVRHILSGWDHVLFVVCLALGATRLHTLVARATGFTIGHSVTLIAGFFGFVPSGAWFIPAVEMGIALSIIYAAMVAVRPAHADRGERSLFFITAAIGLLHGLGFSFVLHEILQVDAPNIWQTLLAFNVGVEIGQLIIIAVAWPLFLLIRWAGARPWWVGRWGIAIACSAIALFWTGQRALMVMTALGA
jgi:hypothetical protein